jgi:hypothetical protein
LAEPANLFDHHADPNKYSTSLHNFKTLTYSSSSTSPSSSAVSTKDFDLELTCSHEHSLSSSSSIHVYALEFIAAFPNLSSKVGLKLLSCAPPSISSASASSSSSSKYENVNMNHAKPAHSEVSSSFLEDEVVDDDETEEDMESQWAQWEERFTTFLHSSSTSLSSSSLSDSVLQNRVGLANSPCMCISSNERSFRSDSKNNHLCKSRG